MSTLIREGLECMLTPQEVLPQPEARLSLPQWTWAVKARDKQTCQRCKEKGFAAFDLHAHHLHPIALGGENTLMNGMTLCRWCHDDIHRQSPAVLRQTTNDTAPGAAAARAAEIREGR